MSELVFVCNAPLVLQIYLWIPETLTGFTVAASVAGGDDLEVVWSTRIWTT